jgi:hypothetical protein
VNYELGRMGLAVVMDCFKILPQKLAQKDQRKPQNVTIRTVNIRAENLPIFVPVKCEAGI